MFIRNRDKKGALTGVGAALLLGHIIRINTILHHLVRHLLEYRAESSDIQPHHQVLQTVPAGEVSHHVRVSWSYAQRQVRILLNLSTEAETPFKKLG